MLKFARPSLIDQMREMDEKTLAFLLVQCRGTGEEGENIEQEINRLLAAYRKDGLIKEIMEWATDKNYSRLEDYEPCEAELLKLAGEHFGIRPREGETTVEFEKAIVDRWIREVFTKIAEKLREKPEENEKIIERISEVLEEIDRVNMKELLQLSGVNAENVDESELIEKFIETGEEGLLQKGLLKMGTRGYRVIYRFFSIFSEKYIRTSGSISHILRDFVVASLGGIGIWILWKLYRVKKDIKSKILANILIPAVFMEGYVKM